MAIMRVPVASDTFDSSITGNWTNGPGNADPLAWAAGGYVVNSTAADCAMCYTGASFNNNQWSKTVVQSQTGGSYGSTWAVARMNSTNGQCYFGQMRESADSIRFALWEASTSFGTTNLANSGAAAGFVAGDYVLLEARGVDLNLYAKINGGAETLRLSAFDATISSGSPGCGINTDSTYQITAWEGGNLAPAPTLDASSPASFNVVHTGTGGNYSATSPQFSPPADSWLYLHVPVDTPATPSPAPVCNTPTNTGTALSWALVGNITNNNGGSVWVWRAYNLNSQSNITVSVSGTTSGSEGGSTRSEATLSIWTGCAINQTGAAVATSTSVADPGAPSVTTTRANSRVAGEGIDWNATGSATSNDLFDPYHIDVTTSGMNVHKAENTPDANTSVSLNFNWAAVPIASYVVYEILASLTDSPPHARKFSAFDPAWLRLHNQR